MNGYLFKPAITLLFFLALTGKAAAQALKFLIPDAAIVQFAGSIGYFSAGAGYDLFKNKRGSLDFTYGYVPENRGGKLHIVAAKFAYRPFELKVKDWAKIYPFNPGVFLSYTFQDDLSFRFDKNQYPKGYYYWSEALRPHLSFSNEIEFNMKKVWKSSGIKALALYSEFNSNDHYLTNYLQNMSTISLAETFQLGIGMRVKF